jgi:hypothetical protein
VLSHVPAHEKVRFRRSEIKDLNAFPSAADSHTARRVWSPPPNRERKWWLAAIAAGAAILLLVVLVPLVGTTDFMRERLRQQAETAIAAIVGSDVSARIGSVSLSVDASRMIALNVSDARVRASGGEEDALTVGEMTFGIRFLPLLRGELRLGSARLADARIVPAALPREDRAGLPSALVDDRGLVDPDLATREVFSLLQRLVTGLERGGTQSIELENVEMALGPVEHRRVLSVASANLAHVDTGTMAIDMELAWRGSAMTLSGEAVRGSDGLIDRLRLEAVLPATDPAPAEDDDTPAVAGFGGGTVTITGSQRAQGEGRLTFRGRLDGVPLAWGQMDPLQAGLSIVATAETGTGKLEIERARLTSGRSTWEFNGAVGPVPASSPDPDGMGYRFELVSNGSVIAPSDSSEAPLHAVARFSGRADPAERLVILDEIGLRSAQGEMTGTGRVQLAEAGPPGIELDLGIARMPVGEVKQIWPWFAARGARNWLLANVYGGLVSEAGIAFSVEPGRLGNGVPLGPEEVSGQFVISGTRFDVAGNIPPVRDGSGTVAFRGSDVDIALDSGTVFMPSGRSVTTSGGTLTIREAHRQPVIGKLRINVEGTAAGIMELAGYDPINADSFIDIAPDDLDGAVTGLVEADIPLHRNIPVETLGWRVALDYEGLSLAKTFDGQEVTQAKGTIVVEPDRARIEADARLNGAPARISLVEPIGGSGVERERKIAVQLDDAARNAMVPGLDMLLTGSSSVELDERIEGRRIVNADLSGSTLSLPWIGWSKGTGVSANASFAMTSDGERTQLVEFRLSGDTFNVAGAMSFVGGEVARARFPTARLNRNDDFSFDLSKQGSGYAITVRGRSIDARSVVKLFSRDASGDAPATGSSEGMPVSIDLKVDTVTGFNGEMLRDVTLSYEATGSRVTNASFAATTAAGRPVVFRENNDGQTRNVAMQSTDAGAVLRFLDIYQHMQGGEITLSLAARGNGPLRGQVDARNFLVVNEPRLSSLVQSPSGPDGRSLNQTVRGSIDAERVQFERGFSVIEKGPGYLALDRGVLRGPLVGAVFQGTFYDRAGNMAMTGTLMPAYGINRIFGEIPIIGQILGNGRDRGLIGITFRLAGKASEPQLEINPLSAVAPGIFRSIFEYN